MTCELGTSTINSGKQLRNPLSPPVLAIVIPCYNEEPVLGQTASVLSEKLRSLKTRQQVSSKSFVLFIDDGSGDRTWEIACRLHADSPELFHAVKFSHNRGHQNAIYAGLMESLRMGCDAAISMDADLQDDPNAIDDMVRSYRAGNQIVYGIRNNRDTDTAFKRITAESFYKLMTWMGAGTIPDHADFRLMSNAAIRALSQYSESNLFLRGIIPSLGFQSDKVFYKRGTRTAGTTKYPLSKMISFALEGITSFSVKPLHMITSTGFLSVIIGFIMLIYTILSICTGHTIAGWASMMFSIWILGGLILVSLGVVGEYIGKIYLETKHRPRYTIEQSI
ncbi:glycosyltransferase family 2 protein [Bifidobacterium boum]|uniref:glycosyltransferase family 2 protein n=1 Tax=Bifidobacterium boum TaxID=78343 RepID=UPI003F914DF5